MLKTRCDIGNRNQDQDVKMKRKHELVKAPDTITCSNAIHSKTLDKAVPGSKVFHFQTVSCSVV